MAMMSLGMFVFELKSAPFQELQHQLGWRHASNSRVGARPARQFCGPDDETVTLTGQLYPELTGGQPSLDDLREMGDSGQAYPLIAGTGDIYGQFIIEGLQQTKAVFFEDGIARKIDFSLTLKRVDDDKVNTRRNRTGAAQ